MTRFQAMLLGSVVASATMVLGVALFKPDPGEVAAAEWGHVEAPRVELKFAGIPPRAPLRLAPQPGQRNELELTLWDSSSLTMLGEGASSTWEGRVLVRTEVEEVQPDGRVRFSWAVRSAKLVAEEGTGRFAGGAAKAGLEALEGVKGESWLDDRGHVLESTVRGGRGGGLMGPQMRAGLERMFSEPGPQLPEPPVGERAEWVVHRVVLNGGVPMQSQERWKLERLTDAGLELSVRMEGEGEAPTPQLPGLELLGDGEAPRITEEGGGAWLYGSGRGLGLTGEGWGRTGMAMPASGPELRLAIQGESELVIQRK